MCFRCLTYISDNRLDYKSPILSDEVYMLVQEGSPDCFDWLNNFSLKISYDF